MTRSIIAFVLATLPLAAQTSSLQGSITDAQSAAIPEAVVTATNLGTSASRKALTDATGEYTFVQVQPGTYKIVVEKAGFRTHTAEVVLQINTPATLNVKLDLGQVTETVNVMGEAANRFATARPAGAGCDPSVRSRRRCVRALRPDSAAPDRCDPGRGESAMA